MNEQDIEKIKAAAVLEEFIDPLAKMLAITGNMLTAACVAEAAAAECQRALDGMKAAYPLRVEKGAMKQEDADTKIYDMGNAQKICAYLAVELEHFATEPTGENQ